MIKDQDDLGGSWWQPAANVLLELRATFLTLFVIFLLAALCYSVYYVKSLRSMPAITSDVTSAIKLAERQGGGDKALRAAIDEVLINQSTEKFWQEFFLHLAVAFVVAFTVISSVEIYSSVRRRREVREHERKLAISVWKAIFERFIPESIVNELEGIVKAEVIKEECKYTLTFCRPYPDLVNEHIILKREVSYRLRNIRNRLVEAKVRSVISSEQPDRTVTDRSGNHVVVPRHVRIDVDGVTLPLDQFVSTDDRGQARVLECPVKVGRNQAPIEVYLCNEEVVPMCGINWYLQLTPIHHLTVEVRNNCEDLVEILDVQYNHPNWAEVKRKPGWVYEYQGGILPGQSFQVSWTAKTAQIVEGGKGVGEGQAPPLVACNS
jgi:hypothetical protein